MARSVSRRLVLMSCGVGAAAFACSDSETTLGGGGNAGTSGGNGGTNNTSGTINTGGMNNTGGTANTGGMNSGGSSAGGSGAGSCGAALLVKGSNYASDPHDLTIPLADLIAGVAKTYTTTGTNHTHTVTVTEADFTALQNGEAVKKYVCYSQPGATDHEWVISCADPNIMPTFEGEIGTPNNCPA